MARIDDRSPLAHRDAAADLSGDLILECERAVSRRNPRQLDPKRWSKRLWCKRLEVEPSRRRNSPPDHAARTAFQISGAVLFLMRSCRV